MDLRFRSLAAFFAPLLLITSCGDEGGESPGDGGLDVGTDIGVDTGMSDVADVADTADVPTGPTLEALHASVIAPTCGGLACHLDGQSFGGLDLDLDDGLLDRLLAPSSVEGFDIVAPGDPDSSYMYLKLTGEYLSVGGTGSLMPLGTSGLSEAELDEVAEWIESLPAE